MDSRISVQTHPRVLGWRSTAALALGGSNQSLFLIGAVLASQGTAAVPLLIVGLLLAWAQLFGWTELVLMWPNRVGGIAAVCAEAFRPYSAILANLTGVCYWWGWVPTCGLTAILSASALHQWCLPGVPVDLMAASLVAVFTAVNLCGVRWAARLAVPLALASAALAFLSVLIPILSGHVDWHRAVSFHLHTPFGGVFGHLTSAMAGLYLIGFAAPAFEAAACHVGETIDPERNVPRAMFAAAGMATLYFAVIPVVWLGVFGSHPLEGDLASVLGPTFAPLFGAGAKAAAIAFMTLNMFHGTLQPLAGSARTLSQLAEDGLLPRALARRSRRDVPYVATVLTAVMATVFLLTGDPTWIIAAANLTYLIGVCLPSLAVWILRRRSPEMHRPYRAPRGLVTTGLLAGCVWLLATLLGFEQFGLPTVLGGLALAYSGSLLYGLRQLEDRRHEGRRGVGRSLQLKLTGAMVIVVALDGLGYRFAIANLDHAHHAMLVAALEDIFVAAALLTITLGLVLPGAIAHAATQLASAAERLRSGTVRELTEAMEALAAGDLDRAHARFDATPVVVSSRDEIGEMAASFNAMQVEIATVAESLDGAREGLRDARQQLRAQNAELESWGSELEARVADRTAELQRANDELAAIATLDPLTGLPNHRVLVLALEREIARSRRSGHEMSLLFVDIDHFKALNDTLGHGAGDAALHDVGVVMRSALRPADTVGRWGGEEFLVILPETSASDGIALAERLRATVAGHRFLEGGAMRLTVSIGAATLPGDGMNRRELTEAADRAMYTAKRLGRNRVFAAGDSITLTAEALETLVEPRDGGVGVGAVEALTALVGMRDRDAVAHMDAVSALAVRLAVELGLDPAQARIVGTAGALHDVGKVKVPDVILHKPGPLDDAEWQVMRRHPADGAETLTGIRALREAAPLVRGHHERWDGSGYPDGLAGEQIPVGARILAVADAFQTITHHRAYAPARTSDCARREILAGAGSQFDPTVVAALERVLESDSGRLFADAA